MSSVLELYERKFVVGPFQCNCRLLACLTTGEAVLVDAGDEAGKILKGLQGVEVAPGVPLQLKYLFHTHGHLDHIAATREVKKETGGTAKIALHKEDEPLYANLKMQGQMFGIRYDDPAPVDLYFEHEQTLKVGKLKFTIVHTPGHSPGSVCIRLHEDSQAGSKETLFSGDTLFQGSVGRTDLWGANQEQMFKNIKTRILTLDEDIRVCPGHGPDTRVGVEKRSNPFLT
jgi:glyoxylase-like metal-dependent hydrolase (beta-lactamase superfamily II)